MRPIAVIPLVFSIVAFVLSILCLFAGTKPGYMEEYHIITVNTSGLGQNLFKQSAAPSATTPACTKPTSLGSLISGAKDCVEGAASNAVDEIQNIANEVAGDIVDKLSQKIGIKQFYSLHLMNRCEGNYKPNATDPSASKNVTKCSNQTAMYHFDITTPLNAELAKGPLNLTLEKLHFPDDIQDGLDGLSVGLNAIFVFYAIGIASSGIVILLCPLYFFFGLPMLTLLNSCLASLSFTALIISSAIVTVVQKKAAGFINKYGGKVGIEAYPGGKYLALTWSSVAFMGVASIVCAIDYTALKRRKRRELSEKGEHGRC
ncbi:actin cortical patch SUR7/pH-response regulator pali [Amylocarpus encephaloides]|uniref:Actin cortical patch SUR7/pH-response regulator pali n=1 Tax=Amylocarpus encephaloides TaxID=45428 RepID=A0A9P8CA54_9HELO|nr:actin cortical patch SUR7/pH-response regulator pali [Amylocarpus encephaloides]